MKTGNAKSLGSDKSDPYIDPMAKAMTLVEVMVSMVILGIIAVGIYATFSIISKGTGKIGSLDIQAAGYARETLEKLKNVVSADPTRAAPLNAGTNIVDPLPAGDFKDVSGGTRTYDVVDVDADDDGTTDYKKVTVTVRWN